MPMLSDFIKAFITSRDITASELSVLLDYKSKTSLQRLVQGQCTGESAKRFAEKLKEKFTLSESELSELDGCVMTCVLGPSVYESEMEMWAFLQGCVRDCACLTIEDMKTGRKGTLRELYENSADIRLTVLNCPYVPIFDDMQKLLRMGAQVDHYIYVDLNNARTICMMNLIMPLLFERRYASYTVNAQNPDASFVPFGVMRADMAFCEHTDSSGVRRDDLLLFDSGTHGRLVSHEASGFSLRSVFIPDTCAYSPMKKTFKECESLSDYIEFSREFAEMEFNKPLYKIKPDLCVDYIPGDILGAALREGPIPHAPGFDEVAAVLVDIYTKRNLDAFTRRKPAHVIFKKEAMWDFCKTGRSKDHFWGMRAYTPRERARIISGLLKQQRENPYMHMYFLTDSSLVRDANINFCEGSGLLILDETTDYKLSDRHSNVLVRHPEFTRLFKKFMLGYLVPKYVYPESETCAVLEDMVDYCKMLDA